MANRFFQQFSFGLAHYPVTLHGKATIGASGATSGLVGSGIASLTRLAQGVYALKLEDNYYRFYGLDVTFDAPVTGSNVTAGSFVSGTLYEITALGSTDWTAIGLPSGVTAAVGVSFVATGAGSGTGTAKAVGSSGIFVSEVVGDPQLGLAPSVQGAVIYFQTLNASGALTDPASGCNMYFTVKLRNSGIKDKGE